MQITSEPMTALATKDLPGQEHGLRDPSLPLAGRLVLVQAMETGYPDAAALSASFLQGDDVAGEARLYAMVPEKIRGESRAKFSAETWMAGAETFTFQCQDPRRGDQWTFCLSRATLEELDPNRPFAHASAFDSNRARIYSAASARMKVADPLLPQVLSAYDVRYARTGARKDEAKREGKRHR
jgi:hypothetical protein